MKLYEKKYDFISVFIFSFPKKKVEFFVIYISYKLNCFYYMAKKSSNTIGGAGSIFDILKKVDNSAEVLSESKSAVIKDYIDTGSYILNACITGSLFKGVPSGRVTLISGMPSTGKTFLALSICRSAQKKGYIPIYMDSEGAIDVEFVSRLGCDPSRFFIKQVTTIREVSTFMANTLKELLEANEETRDKVIFVLDSIGNLTSDKELNTTLEGGSTRDMTKQQEVKALFRTNATALSKANVPLIVCTHTYQSLDLYSTAKISGGSGALYNASVTLMLSTAKLDDKASDKIAENKTGDFIKTGVLVTAKPEKSRFTIPQKVQFQIPFFKAPNPYTGLEKYLTWENSGILRGKLLTTKEYDKMSDSDKSSCHEIKDENNNTVYAYPKLTSNKIVVKHLGCELPIAELFTSKVLTEELLHKLDDEVIRPLFELPSQDSMDDINELYETEENE